jgi:hypothetical protein
MDGRHQHHPGKGVKASVADESAKPDDPACNDQKQPRHQPARSWVARVFRSIGVGGVMSDAVTRTRAR